MVILYAKKVFELHASYGCNVCGLARCVCVSFCATVCFLLLLWNFSKDAVFAPAAEESRLLRRQPVPTKNEFPTLRQPRPGTHLPHRLQYQRKYSKADLLPEGYTRVAICRMRHHHSNAARIENMKNSFRSPTQFCSATCPATCEMYFVQVKEVSTRVCESTLLFLLSTDTHALVRSASLSPPVSASSRILLLALGIQLCLCMLVAGFLCLSSQQRCALQAARWQLLY